jgi:hypothetical protein
MHGNRIAESFIRGLLKESSSTMTISLITGADTDVLAAADAVTSDEELLPEILQKFSQDLSAMIEAEVKGN